MAKAEPAKGKSGSKPADTASEIAAPGEQIKRLRSEAGMSQTRFAADLETSQSAVARMESADYDGHSLTSLRRAAAVLGRELVVYFATEEELASILKLLPATSETEPSGARRGRPPKSES